ncbi:RloB family protein [Methylobacter sp. G7]|uniref:RloB family protein n=1 Tax=Methylobacter sp. G7 TaxID=3230117 RepID=UPI003D807FC8
MARDSNSLKRQKPKFKPQPKVLVICEDSKSGKRYLEDASLHFRVNVLVEITHCGNTDPKGIVTEAISRQGKFDRVFCAIDRDTHETFDEALNLVRDSKKVEIIASYPCFEFWLLLHFGYNRKPYAAAGNHSAADLLIKDLRTNSGMEKYDKGKVLGIFQLLLNRLAEARRIAPIVLAEAIASEQMNPSTRLHEQLDFFEELSSPRKAAPTP